MKGVLSLQTIAPMNLVQVGEKVADRLWAVVHNMYVETQTEFEPQDTGKHIRHFSQGLVPAQINDKCGYLDESGHLAIPAQFSEEAGHFSFPDQPFRLSDF
jgi:hypothetical protein